VTGDVMALVLSTTDHVCPAKIGDGSTATETSDEECSFYVHRSEYIQELRSELRWTVVVCKCNLAGGGTAVNDCSCVYVSGNSREKGIIDR